MAREDPQLKLRLTEEMKDRITRAARDNNRSVNAEIVARLQSIFDAEDSSLTSDDMLTLSLRQNETLLKEMRHQTEVLNWMHEQQSGLVNLLEAIAKTDGNLKPELMQVLRSMVANKGKGDSGFPKHPDGDD